MTTPTTLQPGETYRDDTVKGLLLRHRGNTKSWHVYYRTKNGVERKPKIGEFPTLPLSKARELARDMLAKVWAGEDPSQERKLGRQMSATVSDLCGLYMERHGSKKKSAKGDLSRIKNYVRPRLGGYAIAEVTPHHIESLHAKISLTKRTQANRVIALLSKMFSLAERWELRPRGSNPCKGIQRNKEKKRVRYLTPDEAEPIAAELARRSVEHREAVLAVRLLLLTGARRSEICGRVLRVVGDQLYVGDAKETDDKWIQLSDTALDLIQTEGLNGKLMPAADYVTHFWGEVCEAVGVSNLHLHDLRHTFASIGISDAGLALPGVGKLLGHSSPATTDRYAHLMKKAKKDAANAIAPLAWALLAPPEPRSRVLDEGVADGRPGDDDAGEVQQDGTEPAEDQAGALVG